MKIPFGDLGRQYRGIKAEIDQALAETLNSGWFILGKRGEQFEQRFAEYCGARFAVGVASGTEALYLALKALDIGAGDEVITVANTCVPTVSAISLAGARVVLVDIDEWSFTMDYHDLERKISSRTRAIIPVHLYGQCADLDTIHRIGSKHGSPVIEDAAQAHGAEYRGKRVGSLSILTCFSFYPTKNLGAYGDGGAITTNDPLLAQKLKMLRNYGERTRFHSSLLGVNSRLDEIQAAILTIKLNYLDRWNARRGQIAQIYSTRIRNNSLKLPQEQPYGKHAYHLYVVRVPKRTQLRDFLARRGIETQIHYPIPIHLQEAYQNIGYTEGDFPIAEALSKDIVSLPIYPELTDDEVAYICASINEFV